MLKTICGAAALVCCLTTGASAKDTRFWNLTAHTITAFQLSPAGKDEWGADQTANDSDHSVDADERLKITGVKSGVYDVKFADKTGRSCILRDIGITEGAVFSIDEKKAAACRR
jgi:hypothetical protein